MKPSAKARRDARRRASRRPWFKAYRARMAAGLEQCRLCFRRSPRVRLVFAHIVPHSRGGPYSLDNLTILCYDHDRRCGPVRLSGVMSLAEEESLSPPEKRWSEIAQRSAAENWNPETRSIRMEGWDWKCSV